MMDKHKTFHYWTNLNPLLMKKSRRHVQDENKLFDVY